MLKITIVKDKNEVVLHCEGRLAGRMVREAEQCWKTVCNGNPRQPIRVDLKSVTYIDQAGKAFLTDIHQQGAVLEASGCLTKALVEEISRRRPNKE